MTNKKDLETRDQQKGENQNRFEILQDDKASNKETHQTDQTKDNHKKDLDANLNNQDRPKKMKQEIAKASIEVIEPEIVDMEIGDLDLD